MLDDLRCRIVREDYVTVSNLELVKVSDKSDSCSADSFSRNSIGHLCCGEGTFLRHQLLGDPHRSLRVGPQRSLPYKPRGNHQITSTNNESKLEPINSD